MTYSSGGVDVLTLYALLVYLSSLRWYICKGNQDLTVWDLKRFSQIVQEDSRMGDLKHKASRGRLVVDLAAMSRSERSTKLLEHTALASHVFRVLVDGARVVEVAPAVSMIWCLGLHEEPWIPPLHGAPTVRW
jgi:hypothetical protein